MQPPHAKPTTFLQPRRPTGGQALVSREACQRFLDVVTDGKMRVVQAAAAIEIVSKTVQSQDTGRLRHAFPFRTSSVGGRPIVRTLDDPRKVLTVQVEDGTWYALDRGSDCWVSIDPPATQPPRPETLDEELERMAREIRAREDWEADERERLGCTTAEMIARHCPTPQPAKPDVPVWHNVVLAAASACFGVGYLLHGYEIAAAISFIPAPVLCLVLLSGRKS